MELSNCLMYMTMKNSIYVYIIDQMESGLLIK